MKIWHNEPWADVFDYCLCGESQLLFVVAACLTSLIVLGVVAAESLFK